MKAENYNVFGQCKRCREAVAMCRCTARQKAWVTRRERYGARGHDSTYSRPSHAIERRALRLVLRLHEDGTLSEGQCCKALDIDRVEFRALADAALSTKGEDADV